MIHYSISQYGSGIKRIRDCIRVSLQRNTQIPELILKMKTTLEVCQGKTGGWIWKKHLGFGYSRKRAIDANQPCWCQTSVRLFRPGHALFVTQWVFLMRGLFSGADRLLTQPWGVSITIWDLQLRTQRWLCEHSQDLREFPRILTPAQKKAVPPWPEQQVVLDLSEDRSPPHWPGNPCTSTSFAFWK